MATIAPMLQEIYSGFSVTIQDTQVVISDLFLMSLANS